MSLDDYAIGSRDGQYIYGLFIEVTRKTPFLNSEQMAVSPH
jgi:hypothetical protein